MAGRSELESKGMIRKIDAWLKAHCERLTVWGGAFFLTASLILTAVLLVQK